MANSRAQDRPTADRHQIDAGGGGDAKHSKAARLTAVDVDSPARSRARSDGSPHRRRFGIGVSLWILVATWMSTLPVSPASTAAQAILCSTVQASVVPTATGAIDRLSVRGRAASSQGERGIVAIGAAVDGMGHNSPLHETPKAARHSCNSRGERHVLRKVKLMSAMSLLLNVLWIVFGGLYMAAAWLIAALIMVVTIVGIPWARAALPWRFICFCRLGRRSSTARPASAQGRSASSAI